MLFINNFISSILLFYISFELMNWKILLLLFFLNFLRIIIYININKYYKNLIKNIIKFIIKTWPLERRTLEAEVMWQLPTITSSHPVWFPSRRLVPPHLRHRVDDTSAYKLEEYPIVRTRIRYNTKWQRRAESDNKDLERW